MKSEQAIKKAENRLAVCCYNGETLNNKGLAEAYRREADWLSVVLYLAKKAVQTGEVAE